MINYILMNFNEKPKFTSIFEEDNANNAQFWQISYD